MAGHLDQIGMGEHVARARLRQLLESLGIGDPGLLHAPPAPFGQRGGVPGSRIRAG